MEPPAIADSSLTPNPPTAPTIKVVARVHRFQINNDDDLPCVEITSHNSLSIINRSDSTSSSPKLFTFDEVIDANVTQQTFYDRCAATVVSSFLGGKDGTVSAYGETQSGKTFTLEGSSTQPGIIPIAFENIFQTLCTPSNQVFALSVSYIGMYNELLYDFLADGRHPVQCERIKSSPSPELGAYIPNLTTVAVSTLERLQVAYELGKRNVMIGSTTMGTSTSRMIKFLILTLTKTLNNDKIQASKLTFVELAGSERQKKTGCSGQSLKEAAKIGQSLNAFIEVISALTQNANVAEGVPKVKHVPFRNSSLTRLLQPALSSNGNLVIIATCRCEGEHYQETISTLRVASRVKRMRGDESKAVVAILPLIADVEPVKEMTTSILAVEKQVIDSDDGIEPVRAIAWFNGSFYSLNLSSRVPVDALAAAVTEAAKSNAQAGVLSFDAVLGCSSSPQTVYEACAESSVSRFLNSIDLKHRIVFDPTTSSMTIAVADPSTTANIFSFFDAVLDSSSSSPQSVYETCASSTVSGFLRGKDATIMAYGSTNSRKDQLIFGSQVEPSGGVLPLALQNIFQHLSSLPTSAVYHLSLSYMGIYCEQIYDLLSPSIDFTNSSNNLVLKETVELGVHIPNLTIVNVNSVEETVTYLHNAKQQLAMINTMIMAGSLSYSLTEMITITLHHGNSSTSKLKVVSVQGSERVSSLPSSKSEELKRVSKSLLALGNVISALAFNSNENGKKLHVPYRDSKLTRLLQPALFGQGSLTVIACCVCEELRVEHSIDSLKFVGRMKMTRGCGSDRGRHVMNEEKKVKEEQKENVQEQNESEDWVVIDENDLV